MTSLPRVQGLDDSFALLREGYRYIGNRCRSLGSDVFETRLLGRPTVCCLGRSAGRTFYDESVMQREGAMPGWVRNTLLGNGGVQSLDDAPHRARKAMFMKLMSRERLDEMAVLMEQELARAAWQWSERSELVLRDEMRLVLLRAACHWTGVPLAAGEETSRAKDLDLMVLGSATALRRHWQARGARRRAEQWAARLVEEVRAGRLEVPEGDALHVVAHHQDPDAGGPLPPQVAAVELLNVLRPTVAISIYIAFAALALHQHPAAGRALAAAENGALESFVMEVRRYYPFFPFAAAVTRRPFFWEGATIPEGRRVLFDLYGTNHDPRLWDAPDSFRYDRFCGGEAGQFDLVPQGGGFYDLHHRCAGEWLTVTVMKAVVRFLVRELVYQVPDQDLTVPMNHFPTAPRSGFRVAHVRFPET